jgi:hypothetical protein
MKKTVWCVALCLFVGLGTVQGQDLRIDFSLTNGVVEEGYQAYRADHEVPATFTAQSFTAFGTTVTLLPTWATGATAAAMQMIERPDDDASEAKNLVRDWIGTDGRQPGDPMTLTISGLPAGTYNWVSLHHDPQDQTGIFDVTVNDAAGSTTTTGIDISDVSVLTLADMTRFATTIICNGTDPVSLAFTRTSPVDPVATAFFVMNSFELTLESTGGAMLPSPAHQAVDVLRTGTIFSWTAGLDATAHDVYLGTSLDEVSVATTASSAYAGRQDATSYDPGVLELGRTYYWRIDEVQADGTVAQGSVWSFTVEPVSIPLAGANIIATASSSNNATEGPEKTIDGSGLDADDQHSTENAAMWLSAAALGEPVSIQYEFDRVYKLHQMLVWNHNTAAEAFVGLGAKDVTIDYSRDGSEWTTLEGVSEFARATGFAAYSANTTVEFDGVAARFVRINITANWGGILPRYGLSEVRFMVIPVRASEPNPASGATGVDPRLVLTWRAGRGAVEHEVYVGTDANDVANETVAAVTATEPSLDATSLLALGQTYYWKVNEVNNAEDPAIWPGEVWSFATSAFLPVDDMESYNDDDNRIYDAWLDGLADAAKGGSQVGYDVSPFAEKGIFHGGAQSMPLRYDNSAANLSEATRTFETPQDWTQFGVKALVIWFYGDPGNTAAQMYVKVNNSKVTYDGDGDNLLRKPWQMWYIDLAGFSGVNLSKVTSLTIGFEGGAGLVFIDDIGLTPLDRQLVTPVQPEATNLVAHFAFEGNVRDNTGKLTATVTGAPTYVEGKAGQAIKLDGARDYIMIEASFDLPVYSAAMWFRVDGGSGARDVLSLYDATGGHGILLEITTSGQVRYLHRPVVGTSGGTDIFSSSGYDDGEWYHTAVVRSADARTLYINGEPAGSSVAQNDPFDKTLARLALGVLRDDSLSRYLPGVIDEVYLYSRALSEAEIAWLAGRTKPFDKP